MRVVILYSDTDSGRPDDKDTLTQRDEIFHTLKNEGCEVSSYAISSFDDIEEALHCHPRESGDPSCIIMDPRFRGDDKHREGKRSEFLKECPDIVFNLVESFGGSDSHSYLVPGYLDTLGIPYTGCKTNAIFLTRDKCLAKKIMIAHNIPTPALIGERYIVKSATEHASLGIDETSIVNSIEKAQKLTREKSQQYGGLWFYEAYIPGREINLALFSHQGQYTILPIAEILFQGDTKIVDYAAKWDETSSAYQQTSRQFLNVQTDAALITSLHAIAMRCFAAFDLRGYARIDFRVDADGNPFVLEINTNPCLSMDAGFMAAALQQGLTHATLIHHLLKSAIYDTTLMPSLHA